MREQRKCMRGQGRAIRRREYLFRESVTTRLVCIQAGRPRRATARRYCGFRSATTSRFFGIPFVFRPPVPYSRPLACGFFLLTHLPVRCGSTTAAAMPISSLTLTACFSGRTRWSVNGQRGKLVRRVVFDPFVVWMRWTLTIAGSRRIQCRMVCGS